MAALVSPTMRMDTSNRAKHYQYLPLAGDNEIRLLRLHRRSEPDCPVEYSIESHDLATAPPYEVVSYVWGESDFCAGIVLQDGQHLGVTPSVQTALPYLVQACEMDYLWIDQVTINQRDLVERNKQVSIMGKIFSSSRRCLIWLEIDPSRKADVGIELDWKVHVGRGIHQFLTSFLVEDFQKSANSPVASKRPDSGFGAEHFLASTKIRDHLFWFLHHRWFTRTWVFQELVLSHNAAFLIRDFLLPAGALEAVFKLGWPPSTAWFEAFRTTLNIDERLASLFNTAPGVEFLVTAFQNNQLQRRSNLCRHYDGNHYTTQQPENLRFADYEALNYGLTLAKMAASHAQDPRDHVYAFIGLAPFLLDHMTIDYNLPVERVFAAMSKALIIESRSLDYFDISPTEADIAHSRLRLPSWVTNYAAATAKVFILGHDNLFNAAGEGYGLPDISKCKHSFAERVEWNELRVAGKVIDTVIYRFRSYSIYQHSPSLEIDVYNTTARLPWEHDTMHDFLTDLAQIIPLEDAMAEKKALLRTLFMDGVIWASIMALTCGEDLYRTGLVVIGEKHNVKINDVIDHLIASPTPEMDNLPHGSTPQLLHELSRVQYRRRMAYCANGKFSLAPDMTEPGDLITILHNSRTPVILRPVPGRNDRFIVIGQCYYDGAMYGELADADDETAQIFLLV